MVIMTATWENTMDIDMWSLKYVLKKYAQVKEKKARMKCIMMSYDEIMCIF